MLVVYTLMKLLLLQTAANHRGLNNYLYYFGGFLLNIMVRWAPEPQNPILIIKSPIVNFYTVLNQLEACQDSWTLKPWAQKQEAFNPTTLAARATTQHPYRPPFGPKPWITLGAWSWRCTSSMVPSTRRLQNFSGIWGVTLPKDPCAHMGVSEN